MNYPLTEEEFRAFYAKMPRACVDLVIRRNGEVFLTKRSIDPYIGQWHLPGGTIYFGETLEQAAKRVAKEEIGVEVTVAKVLDALVYPDEIKDDWHGWPIGINIEANIISGTPTNTKEASDSGFFKKLPYQTVETQRKFLTEKLGFEEEVAEK